MKKLDLRLKKTSTCGIFHDTRQDVQTLTYVCNELITKVNELVAEINILKAGNKNESQKEQ